MADGSFAVQLARKAIEFYVHTGEKYSPRDIPRNYKERRGVFVTINTFPEGNLRGCIGFVDATMPLYQAIIDAAIAATQDPRFQALEKKELTKITVEVSILTGLELIEGEKKDFPEKLRIGEDGIVVKSGDRSGLLLPQVAVDHEMEGIDFLESTSEKAGLEKTAWADEGVEVYKFQADIWKEMKPNGKPVFVELKKS